MIRYQEHQAKADANLEVAWMGAETAERRAAEAAGAAARDERRIRMKMLRPAVRDVVLCVCLCAVCACRLQLCGGERRMCLKMLQPATSTLCFG